MNLLTEVMRPYFDEKVEKDFMDRHSQNDMPIRVSTNEWSQVSDPTRLLKKFEFDSHYSYMNFVNEILLYENDINHLAKMTCEYPQVIIEVYTHDVNTITECDLEYARHADMIRQDVQYYSKEDVYEQR